MEEAYIDIACCLIHLCIKYFQIEKKNLRSRLLRTDFQLKYNLDLFIPNELVYC